MYYFIPKRVERPIYSYRLSIVHFWALIFIYIWAGPHHLHYTALPQWTQTLGMTFSIMLWMPSWGGMINGLMTLSGAWDKLRTDPVVRMLVVALAFYGMATFEGPVMSVRTVNALVALHRLGHRPRALRRAGLGRLHLLRRPLLHGALAVEARAALFRQAWSSGTSGSSTIGVLLYITAMWVSGIHGRPDVAGLHAARLPGLLLRRRPSRPSTWSIVVRALGGLLYLARHADHGLQPGAHHARRRPPGREPAPSPSNLSRSDRPCRSPRPPDHGAHGIWKLHGWLERNSHAPAHRHRRRHRHRRHRRDHPAVLSGEHHREGARHSPLHPARTGRAGHLHPQRAATSAIRR